MIESEHGSCDRAESLFYRNTEELALAVIGRLIVEDARDLSDAELERALSPCVGGHALVKTAKLMRDQGMLHCKCQPQSSPRWVYCPTCEKLRPHCEIGFTDVGSWGQQVPRRVAHGTLVAGKGNLNATAPEIEGPRSSEDDWVCEVCRTSNSCGKRRCCSCGTWR